VTFGLLKLIDKTIGLRVDAEAETEGLDTSLHGEKGYAMGTQGHLAHDDA
jgi:Amt family ammonium transporter